MAARPDETRMTAALPNLDVEVVFRADPAQRTETLTLSLKATPGFEAAAGLLANPALPMALLQASPFALWSRMAMLAWQPWLLAARPFLSMLEPPRRD